jgi:HSCB C-terminal oligomerisation domain
VQVMELQEEAAEARDPATIERLRSENASRRQQVIQGLAAAYSNSQWGQMRRLVQHLAYWNRIEATLLAKS